MSYLDAIDPKFGQYTVDKEILVMPFWTQDFCNFLIQLCVTNSNLFSRGLDKLYDSEEFYFSQLDPLFSEYCQHYEKELLPILGKEWVLHNLGGLSDPYILRYSMDRVRDMKVHTDRSILTLLVKLNSNYSGGDVFFPRQQVSTCDVPVGHAIIFPSQVTHPHYARPITAGERYSFVSFTFGTMWQDRYKIYNFKGNDDA